MEKAEQRYCARFLTLDELYETQGFEPADSSPSDAEDEEKERFRNKLHAAINTLSERQKQIIVMH